MSSASDPSARAAQALGPDRPSSLKSEKGSWVTVSLQRLVQHRLGNFPRKANTFAWARGHNRNNSTANGRPAAESIPTRLPGPPAEPTPDPAEPGPPGEKPESLSEESPVVPQDPQQQHHDNHDHHHQRQASQEDVVELKAVLDQLDSSTAAAEDNPDSTKHSPHQPAEGSKHRRSVSDPEVCVTEDDVDGITLHEITETSGLKIHGTVSKNSSSQDSASTSSKRARHRIPHISLKSLANTNWLRHRRRKGSQPTSPFPVLTAENVQVTRHITVEYHRQLSPPLHNISPPGPDCRIAAEYPDYFNHQALFGGPRLVRLAAQEEEEEEAGDAAGPIAADQPSVFRRGRSRTNSSTVFSGSDHEQGIAGEEQAEDCHTPLSPPRPYKRQPSVVSHISANPGQGRDETPAATTTTAVQFLTRPGKLLGQRRRSFQDSSTTKLRKSKRKPPTRSRTESPHARTELRPEIVPPTPVPELSNHFPAAAKAKVEEVEEAADQTVTSDSPREEPVAPTGQQQQGETI
ncbi:hypothetical protein MAPG_11986 [Magnaporthiopsis poae ATCC 64411]|uniref:Uncharacterized protein n=1 Tax=Magnaporthiopsis poae (strain ATCC 64411 / 73-15) TaxID=644358 RepID=A0A0C4EGL9_MAGP6|nr:hypothetical protein MAPG_11986 [Magnaporthiopsis poae ATCC 64411]